MTMFKEQVITAFDCGVQCIQEHIKYKEWDRAEDTSEQLVNMFKAMADKNMLRADIAIGKIMDEYADVMSDKNEGE